jgi:hypothetical protein
MVKTILCFYGTLFFLVNFLCLLKENVWKIKLRYRNISFNIKSHVTINTVILYHLFYIKITNGVSFGEWYKISDLETNTIVTWRTHNSIWSTGVYINYFRGISFLFKIIIIIITKENTLYFIELKFVLVLRVIVKIKCKQFWVTHIYNNTCE